MILNEADMLSSYLPPCPLCLCSELLLRRLGVEKVVDHPDDRGHAVHQGYVGGAWQDG